MFTSINNHARHECSQSQSEVQGLRATKEKTMDAVIKTFDLYLTNRFISTPSRTRATTNPKSNSQSVPPIPLPTLPNVAVHIIFLLSSPLFRFSKPFQRYIIQLFIFHSQLFSFRPEILTIPKKPKIERVRCFPSSCKSIYSLPFREPVESQEVHQETRTTSAT